MTGQQILGKKLAFIIAHPDDESFLAAGIIHRNHQAGGQAFILCATLGEQGRSHVAKSITTARLKQIRKKELMQVCKLLKVKKLIILDVPDKEVAPAKDSLEKSLPKNLKQLKPDFIFSFGLDGYTGHKDHIAIGKVAKKVAKHLSLPFVAFSGSPMMTKRILKQRRKHGVYADKIKRSKPNLVIPIDSKIKLKALSLHASQHRTKNPLQGIPASVARELLTKEYFHF